MKINKWLVAALGILISLVFLWFAFRNLKPEEVLTVIQKANFTWLLIAAAVYFIGVTLISIRWQFLLRSIRAVPLSKLAPLVAIGYMGNNVYPFRSGEVLRILLLQRNYRVPVTKATTTVVVERVFDGLVMLTFILVSLLFVNIDSDRVRAVAMYAAPIFLTAVAVFFILAARPNVLRSLVHLLGRVVPGKLHTVLVKLGDEVIDGLEGLRSPGDLAGAVVFSFASWMVEASVYWLVSFAFNLGLPYPVFLLIVGVVNLAGLIPASPGQIGVFEFFVTLILVAVGVGSTQAQAYALVVHVVIWLPVTLVGFFFLIRQGLGLGAITHAQELERSAVG
jgi:uncharacterized protein (TIRG00374 family)